MLNQLVHAHILLSSAHPPMSTADPLAHLLHQLPEQAPTARAHALLLRHNTAAPDGTGNQVRRHHAQEQLWKVCPTLAPLAVDTRVDAQLALAPTVVDTAREAARTLLALAPDRSGSPAWVDYHLRCLERYGPGAVIALTELVGPTGMGWPAGYRGSYLPPLPPEPLTSRGHALTRAAHTAALNGSGEVDALDLARNLPAAREVEPPHVEVRAQLQADSPAAVDAGNLSLWITGISRAVGVLTGRFSHLEGVTDHGLTRLPTLTEGALPVQISAPPLVTSAHNIARTRPLLSHLLVIDEHPPPSTPDGPQVLGPEDLLVRIDADHLRLQHRSTGRIVEPHLFSALEPRWHTHPLVRFCYELPRARTAPQLSFTWPSATGTWSRLPRVRAGQAILAPAQWRIEPGQLPAPGASTEVWGRAVQRLREEQQVPHQVRISDGDSYLPLDLKQPAHRYLLRNHLERAKADTPLTLTEAPPSDAFAWCDNRAHELVIPLASAQTATTAPRSLTKLHDPPTAVHLPGSPSWLSAHLYCNSDLHTRILTHRMRGLWERWGGEPVWWAVRYADHDGPHLRIRIPNHHADAPPALAAWADQLRQEGLLRHMRLETYQPETGRYGRGPALEAVHALFSADTTVALAQLHHAANNPSRAHALGAASLFHLVTSAHTTNALEWMIRHLPKGTTPIDRTARALALTLTDLDHGPVPADLRQAWRKRNRAMAVYRELLPSPEHLVDVLPSLLHMHHNRLIGPDRADETRLLELTRALALTVLHRTPAGVR